MPQLNLDFFLYPASLFFIQSLSILQLHLQNSMGNENFYFRIEF